MKQRGNVTETDQLFNGVQKALDIYRNLVYVKIGIEWGKIFYKLCRHNWLTL